ncbi:MAG: 2-amino-4-hydroxy-6-hydroxymethyldihydropteridine diphosphokinase [Caulobacterales bacterium 32-69-10]|nr:MAG: 2-amino-4-hydroxy-6-hydroxymethyldihydropteridine diphosphokinase [Caulobacterales bacterium 32-69-10]
MASGDEVVVALGGNLGGGDLGGDQGGSLAVLEAALARFEAAGLHVLARSSWWRSHAWPDPTQPDYLNGVAIVDTALSPTQTLDALHGIEAELGRVRTTRNAARAVDLDLIAHGRTVLEGALHLPHPRAADRLFVMGPLAQIAPGWVHPVNGKTARELADAATVGVDATPL